MDSLITAAARALASGDPLGALNRVALRNDAPALALRGIAMAQLGDLVRARTLLRNAARAFGPKEPLARARCIVAEAEIALASRELGWPARMLDTARMTLERHGDRINAAHARYIQIRRLLLIGRLDEAEQMSDGMETVPVPPSMMAAHELIVAGIAMRRVQAGAARAALDRAVHAAHQAGIPALVAEIESARLILDAPAARLIEGGEQRFVLLDEVEALLASKALVVDACRYIVSDGRHTAALTTRPVLFTLAWILGEAWPGDVSREVLVAQAFRARLMDESHRARLRVEIGRLRGMLEKVADIRATKCGFVLAPRHAREVFLLARPVEEKHAGVLAFLADGESWSSSALAAAGKVQPFGHGRARRWMTPPLPGFATTLLLPAPLPGD
jgi:hypothetical protein